MKKLTRMLLILFLSILLFPVLSQVTSELETSIIPESNWTKLTNHTEGADASVWSSDGSEILYVTWDETSLGTLYKMKADGSNRESVGVSEIGSPSISPDGSKISFQRYGWIFTMNYDGSNQTPIYHSEGNVARWSPDGSKLVLDERITSVPHVTFRIITINPDGTNRTILTLDNQSFVYPWWSPDGTKIVCQSYEEAENPRGYNPDIWVMDADGNNLHNITQLGDAIFPVWAPDGNIYFWRQPGAPWAYSHIYRMSADGTTVVQLTNSSGEWWPAISPDGKWLAFSAYDENGDRNIYKAELTNMRTCMLNLTPDTGFSSTTVIGSGFALDSKMTLTWDDVVIPTVPSSLITDSNGSFTAIISVLTQNDAGSHSVKATDESGNSANATFTVVEMTESQGGTRELSLLVDAFTIGASIIAICLATIALVKKKNHTQ